MKSDIQIVEDCRPGTISTAAALDVVRLCKAVCDEYTLAEIRALRRQMTQDEDILTQPGPCFFTD